MSENLRAAGYTLAGIACAVYSHFVPARDREHAARLGARLGRSQTP